MGVFDIFKKKNTGDKPSEIRREIPFRPQQATYLRWQIGDKIQGRYEIFQILGGPGKSGMGIVYICYDHEFRKAVVIKTPQLKFLSNRAAIERFKWEAEAWVRLEKHYNIVQAKYVDEIDYRPCIFMEYVVGDEYGANLSGWIHSGGLGRIGKPDIPLILDFAIQFCHGMIHAEKRFQEIGKPFVHRDIKPSNIMVTRDRVVKITDFGLVKAFADLDADIPITTVGDGVNRRLSLSKSGTICGTPPYMSPEQCRGIKDIDTRSDIYAFGCVLYEMLTRRLVFDGVTLDDFIRHHLRTNPVSPNVQPLLDSVVMKCLEKKPVDRYANFKEMEVALSTIFRELTGKEVREPDAVPLGSFELVAKGLSLSRLGLLEEAISCYREALKVKSNEPCAHLNLGVAYDAQGKLDEAISEYREELKLRPDEQLAHSNLGKAYDAQGKRDEAVRELREALRIKPDDARVHTNLGAVYDHQGKPEEAVREYCEALRINPNDAVAHHNLGIAYKYQGKPEEAVREYHEALRINPNYANALKSLGKAYHDQGKQDDAVREYREALKINPNDAETHNNLGFVYFTQGKLNEAVKEYKEALRINPNYVLTHRNLGALYDNQGKRDKAVSEYREALRINPNDAKVHFLLGAVYMHQGKLGELVRELREVLRINPNDAGAHYYLASCIETIGKRSDALEQWKRYLAVAWGVPDQKKQIVEAQQHIKDLEKKLR
jgi:tetratricopeptide (TPR) repeat protein